MPPLGSLLSYPLGAGIKQPIHRGLSDTCPCLILVSQAPREAPARRAPSTAQYLEEKSDQQKKEEVGEGEG